MIISGIPGAFWLVGNITGQDVTIPVWAWVIIIMSGFSIAQFLAYNKLSNRFTKQVITPNKIEGVLENLAKLRESGAKLLLIGSGLRDRKKVPQWTAQVETWKQSVRLEIVEISRSEARLFRQEGIIVTENFGKIALNNEHKVYLAMIDVDMEKIRKLIERYSPRNLAERISSEK